MESKLMFHVKQINKGGLVFMSKENEILWLTYKLFCHNRGLAEGNLKTLEDFMIFRKYFYREDNK